MKKTYNAPKQTVFNIQIEEHILAASPDNISIDNQTEGEAGNSYSNSKSEIWDTNWDEE